MTKRLLILFIVFILSFVQVTLRLYAIATEGNEVYAVQAQRQQQAELTLCQRGGLITDCRGEPLNYEECGYAALVEPDDCGDLLRAARRLAAASELTVKEAEKRLEQGAPFGIMLHAPVEEEGIICFPALQRRATPPAIHLVGTLSADGSKARSGMEAAYESYLRSCSARVYAALQKTAAGGLLSTKAALIDEGYHRTSGVMTTLDIRLQEALEQATTELASGAAILMRLDGSIAAAVSRPAYGGDEVGALLDSEHGELINRVLAPYNVGSIFKLVVAAQTLERGAQTPVFNCPGSVMVEGRVFYCHKRDGHGVLTLEEAMEKSCNVYFISLLLQQGEEGYFATLEMARKLGIDDGSLLCRGVAEQAGNLPVEVWSGQLAANLAIGQGSLLATPLDLAQLTCCIASGGVLQQPRLIEGMLQEGKLLRDLADGKSEPVRLLSAETAQKLRHMMEETCRRGTGTTAQPEEFSVGGKTASAETGWVEQGEPVVHGSFAGYFPADDPQFGLVVIVENGKSGSVSAAPIFREAAQRTMEILAGSEEPRKMRNNRGGPGADYITG